MRVSAVSFLWSFVLGTSIVFGYWAYANADSCPNGETAITEATRAAATAAGIPANVTCWNANDPNAGLAAGEAKEYLMQHATKGANISCLNSDYAEKLANLMKAVPGGPPVITDGYRGTAAQQKALQNGASQVGACHSYHQYGLAADFNNANAQTLLWMRFNAPQFGLTRIPALSVQTGCSLKGTGFCDPAHIQINGSLPPVSQCGICSTTGGYGTLPGGANLPAIPDDYEYYRTNPQVFFTPTPVGTFSSPLGMTSMPAPATVPTQTQTQTQTQNPAGTQPQICDPKFTCNGNVTYYQTSSCTTQVYQVCQNGCAASGTACAVSTSTTATSTASLTATTTGAGTNTDSTNTNSNTNANGTGPSVMDLLNAIGNPVSFSATDVGTSTSLAFTLNPNTGDVVQLDGSQSPTSGIAAGTITSVQPMSGLQTFTSSDLGSTYGGQYPGQYQPQQTSAFQSILSGLQSALTWALNVLRSIGGSGTANATNAQFAP